MISVKLKNLKNPDKWITINNGDDYIYVRGYFYYKDKLLKGNDLAIFIQGLSLNKIVQIVKDANGFFAVIKKEKDKLIAVVDRLRSIPIFYGVEGENLYLSDDAHWILENLKDKSANEISKKEFLATGYVTGQDTLYKNVKQIQAGEILLVDDVNKNVKIKTERYYIYARQEDFNEDFETLLKRLDNVLENTFARLVKVLNGRPAVIPLSGGYDSRLIAVMLKEFNYKEVICFSYGKPGNTESQISQQVAENLGYRWEFVPYSNKSWYDWYRTKEMQDYMFFSDGLSSLPHIQDWPAVWELKKNNKIPEDSVFIPGHSADFIAGSHITNVYRDYGKLHGEKKLIKAIIDYHYSLNKWTKEDFVIFKDKILSFLSYYYSPDIDSFEGLANFYEYWDWQERQSKFIVNSVRVYEFWGYDWLIPLWDNELMDFFTKVPLQYRLNKKLYDTYVNKKYKSFTKSHDEILPRLTIKKLIKELIYLLGVSRFAKTAYMKANSIFYKKEYYGHPLSWYGIVGLEEFKNYYTGRENINSFLVKKYLEKLT
jgi:asparagine synthase (glutamine-hydrolysing)